MPWDRKKQTLYEFRRKYKKPKNDESTPREEQEDTNRRGSRGTAAEIQVVDDQRATHAYEKTGRSSSQGKATSARWKNSGDAARRTAAQDSNGDSASGGEENQPRRKSKLQQRGKRNRHDLDTSSDESDSEDRSCRKIAFNKFSSFSPTSSISMSQQSHLSQFKSPLESQQSASARKADEVTDVKDTKRLSQQTNAVSQHSPTTKISITSPDKPKKPLFSLPTSMRALKPKKPESDEESVWSDTDEEPTPKPALAQTIPTGKESKIDTHFEPSDDEEEERPMSIDEGSDEAEAKAKQLEDEESRYLREAEAAPADRDNGDDGDDLLFQTPKKKQKKQEIARNPLAIQRQEEQEVKARQQLNLLREHKKEEEKLWYSDEEEPVVPRPRRGLNAGTTVAAARAAPREEGTDRSNQQKEGRLACGQSPPKNDQESSAASDRYISTCTKEERKQHPIIPDPTFGPFADEPLVLTNAKTEAKDHQVPAALARYLPTFQREGIQFMYNSIANGEGVMICDDMGLGKTLQVISLLAALLEKRGNETDEIALLKRKKAAAALKKDWDRKMHLALTTTDFSVIELKENEGKIMAAEKAKMGTPDSAPILVVVPASVVDNWDYEFMMWGHFGVTVYRDEQEREVALDQIKYGASEVLLCGHSLFQAAKSFIPLTEITWKLIVVDEFHSFKSKKSNLFKNLRAITSKSDCPVLGMTGTPMQNRFEELHSLVELVRPNLLGEEKEFMGAIGEPLKLARTVTADDEMQRIGEEKQKVLKELLADVYIQRYKTDVLKNLPKKVEHVVFCELSEEQKETYEHVRNLTDFTYVRWANLACDCGRNQNYFEHFRRLQTPSERAHYLRDNDFVKRRKCCYKSPKHEESAVIWHHQHMDGEDCERCPLCLVLPCLMKLNQISTSLTLLQFDRKTKLGDRTSEAARKDRAKRLDFSRICFSKAVLAELPGGIERDERLIDSRAQFDMVSGKLKKLRSLLEKIADDDGRVLLFSGSTQALDLIANFMSEEGHSFLRIDGSTPSKHRQSLVDKFQRDDNYFCFLLSTRAAGVGLNLTAANNVVIFDADWNPALDEQAQDRSWRIGQKRDVKVYRLISKGTIDEQRYLRQIYKSHLKQGTFRSAEATDAKAPPRSFLGVEKDKDRKGELFGVENLMKFDRHSSFIAKIWRKNRDNDSGLVAGTSDEIARAIATSGGDKFFEKDREEEIELGVEKAARSYYAKQNYHTQSQSQAEGFCHSDFFQVDRVHLAFGDADEIQQGIGAQFEDYVRKRDDRESLSPQKKNDHRSDEDPAEEIRKANCKCERTEPSRLSRFRQTPPKPPRRSVGRVSHGNNYDICGKPATKIGKEPTTFSVADIFRPPPRPSKK